MFGILFISDESIPGCSWHLCIWGENIDSVVDGPVHGHLGFVHCKLRTNEAEKGQMM